MVIQGEESAGKPAEQQGIRPFMLKSILGKSHTEFASARQQVRGVGVGFRGLCPEG